MLSLIIPNNIIQEIYNSLRFVVQEEVSVTCEARSELSNGNRCTSPAEILVPNWY